MELSCLVVFEYDELVSSLDLEVLSYSVVNFQINFVVHKATN